MSQLFQSFELWKSLQTLIRTPTYHQHKLPIPTAIFINNFPFIFFAANLQDCLPKKLMEI